MMREHVFQIVADARGVALSAVLLVLAAASAQANVGVFGGNGHTPRLETSEDVQLKSEDVTVFLGRGMVPLEGSLRGLDQALFDCRFELVNRSEESVTLQVGFPLRNYTLDFAENEEDAVEALLRYGFVARDDERTYHVGWARKDAEERFSGVFLWTMAFQPGQTRHLRVRYRLPMTTTLAQTDRTPWDDHVYEPAWLQALVSSMLEATGYVTKTGSSWAGKIQKATFTFYTADFEAWLRRRGGWLEEPVGDVSPDVRGAHLESPFVARTVEPEGWEPVRVEGRDEPVGVRWTFEDFEGGPVLRVRYHLTSFPRRAEDLDLFVAALLGSEPSREDLLLLCAILGATCGKVPEPGPARTFVERQVWYHPREDADEEARAFLAALEHLADKAPPRR